MIMVSLPRGHHVLPHQDLRLTLLPPDRREPLGGRTHPTEGRRHPGTTRSTPAGRTTRCPPGLGGTPVPVRTAALGPHQRATPHHHHPTHRACSDLPATLATDRVPARHTATPGRTPLRVRSRAGHLPHRPAPPLRPRQRPGRRQVEVGLPDRGVRPPATAPPLPGHGLARRGVAPGSAEGQDAVRSPVHQGPDRGGSVQPPPRGLLPDFWSSASGSFLRD